MMALVMKMTMVECNVYVSVDDTDNDFGVYWRTLMFIVHGNAGCWWPMTNKVVTATTTRTTTVLTTTPLNEHNKELPL